MGRAHDPGPRTRDHVCRRHPRPRATRGQAPAARTPTRVRGAGPQTRLPRVRARRLEPASAGSARPGTGPDFRRRDGLWVQDVRPTITPGWTKSPLSRLPACARMAAGFGVLA